MVAVKQMREDDLAAAKHLYRNTPVYRIEDIPRGMSAHIGEGWWLTRCSECDEYVEHLGSRPRYWSIGEHEVEVHHIRVAGINGALLA